MPWAALAVAGAGALAGSMGDHSSASSSTGDTSGMTLRNFNDLNQGQSGLEASGYNQQVSGFADLQGLMGIGPGAQQITQNNMFQSQYGNQLQGFMNQIANGGNAQQQQQNYDQAKQYFAPQQTALNQQFQDQGIQQQRLAARLGRSGNDPTMQNMLMKEQTRQQSSLNSQIGAFGQQLPAFQAQQLMSVGNNLSNLRQGLATQAINNRMSMMSMGNQLATSERNYRMQTANRYGTKNYDEVGVKGGGLAGAIAGGLAGAGAGMKLMNAFGDSGSSSGGGGGGGPAVPMSANG